MFDENYRKWQESCIEELTEQGYGVTLDDIEICEDGKIHFIGNFYLTDKLVTSWEESPYYTEI